MYYVYILNLVNNNKYVGYSDNLKNRIIDYNKGSVVPPLNIVHWS